MLITINSVNVTKAPKGYSIANVSYVRDGKAEERKVMSFVDEGVFASLSQLTGFPVNVNVVLRKEKGKDGKEYWQWRGIEVGGAAPKAVEGKPAGKVIGSNYETPEERGRRQIYIIRQSSISSAIEFLKAQQPKGVEANVEQVLKVAKEFETYVMDVAIDPTEMPL